MDHDMHDMDSCRIEQALEVVVGRWKVSILFLLFLGTKRFSELQKAIPQITKKVLTTQLRELEEHDIIQRVVYPEVPPKVEYSITEYGKSLAPVLEVINEWGNKHVEYMKSREPREEKAIQGS
ncbi:winged helix-turn-helix transcriptional regulator [Paenibacillus physcomitrellae]|uniref:Transcriptional regulator n=1 Tax=Paenibacillus physcomitrellae TaxID=1619311 RepID=A0ABQ1FQT6_9BACL|nr:helix-turn-helix domain-containing protein [Paenibacillus physcomitrellae]GGA24617.1 transcriptional regulator [Paenibacillus physcomitrellae]